MSDWQPIETAPLGKDEEFLIYSPFGPACHVVRLEWHAGGRPVWISGDRAVDGTHWMPVPAPPEPA
jgi:hypothetical protein